MNEEIQKIVGTIAQFDSLNDEQKKILIAKLENFTNLSEENLDEIEKIFDREIEFQSKKITELQTKSVENNSAIKNETTRIVPQLRKLYTDFKNFCENNLQKFVAAAKNLNTDFDGKIESIKKSADTDEADAIRASLQNSKSS
jgi:predicted translin family RNA/ssDNA-binding protein